MVYLQAPLFTYYLLWLTGSLVTVKNRKTVRGYRLYIKVQFEITVFPQICHHALYEGLLEYGSLMSLPSGTIFGTDRRKLKIYEISMTSCGPGSSVGIATDYGLDGPESNPGGDEISRPSRPAQGATQPPVQWVPGLSRG